MREWRYIRGEVRGEVHGRGIWEGMERSTWDGV